MPRVTTGEPEATLHPSCPFLRDLLQGASGTLSIDSGIFPCIVSLAFSGTPVNWNSDLWSGSRFSWCVSPTSYIFIFFCSLGDFLSFIFCLFYLYLYFCCHILISKNSFFSCRCFLDTVSFSVSQRWYSCLFPGFSCCVCCLLSPTSFFASFCFHVWCQKLSAVSGGIWPSFSFK